MRLSYTFACLHHAQRQIRNIFKAAILAKPKRIINFAPGPGALPKEVMQEAQADFCSYKGLGIGVLELSHATEEYRQINDEAQTNLREIMRIPDNYKVLFLQAGATGQFAGVPLNICKENDPADYVLTGYWSEKAFKEAQRFCKANKVNSPDGKYTGITPESEWKLSPGAKYLHYCANETIHGVEFHNVPNFPDVDLVCDMSSTICSRPLDVSKFAIIYAGAHKNLGPAGTTIIIVRDDLLENASPSCPSVLNYKNQSDVSSIYNTPPTFTIYICGLVMKWLKERGGLEEIEKTSVAKSSLVYKVIDDSNGFYVSAVEKPYRSRMNIPFTIGNAKGNRTDVEQKFVDDAQGKGLLSLNGHRLVGGLRASLYNAISLEDVEILAEFMEDFQKRYQK